MKDEMLENMELRWPRFTTGYDIEEAPGARAEIKRNVPGVWSDGGICIVSRAGPLEFYDPLKTDGLYRRLADGELTPEGALQFVTTFGFPVRDLLLRERLPLKDYLEAVESMRGLLRLVEAGEWDTLADSIAMPARNFFGLGRDRLGVDLQPREDNQPPAMVLKPSSLWAAIWLQLAIDVSTGASLRSCARCGDWFKHGPGTGRRSTAIYCSPKCQGADAYAKRKAAAK